MESDSGERRIVRSPLFAGTSLPVQDKLKCPRCESSNTKFCYFNNYNLAQPRHYCKDCKRYWTHGGTLRNVPVGGGTRKNTHKRLSNNHNNNNDDSPASHSSSPPTPPQPQQDPPSAIPAYPISSFPVIRNFNSAPATLQCFPTLMNNAHASGFMTYNGFGFDDLSVWPLALPDAPETVNTGGGFVNGGGGGVANAWQLGIGGDGGYADNFTWPDLSISSTPRKSIK